MGLDDPFPLGEIEDIGTSYPGRVLDHAIKTGAITKKEGKDIWHKNVIDWLGVEKNNTLKKKIIL